ncbi:acyl carrier protein [Allomyces macrogynus ATCC 38327]|uniref:Acyl carrier protein n=1 Tax=Allomyces macrogynus (strain ATCC 38327) TaxID=578462 RepID=A0A0L0SP81_ALLM3|nr:hypothetical protein GGF31_007132 [Allomyces arbusculus]KNE60780.1 acyl carrier protein [Allomyces macrogynus ATCC 38327]KNE64199.1 acyl carrier protein [Allomyces macrogynus ATCC 38327]|eukprot:KNE60780.1 acyl carrier protein [Allomyces macrogynus ATCC 38327]
MYALRAALAKSAPRTAVAFQQAALPAVFARFASSVPRAEIEARIVDLLKGFDKVEAAKVSPTAHFTNDLGLDSLDTVEVVMAIEEEFAIEIPDKAADEILTVAQAIDYIASREDAY